MFTVTSDTTSTSDATSPSEAIPTAIPTAGTGATPNPAGTTNPEVSGTTTASSTAANPDAIAASEGSPAAEPADPHSIDRPVVAATVTRPARVLTGAGDLLRALAAPVRIAIVLELREHDRCVHELVETLGVAQPLISQHLRVLKAAGVVDGERHGREVVYRLVDEHLSHIVVDAVAHVEEGTAR